MEKIISAINNKNDEEDNITDEEKLSNLEFDESSVTKETVSVHDKLDRIKKNHSNLIFIFFF